jgi:hypothetical protein
MTAIPAPDVAKLFGLPDESVCSSTGVNGAPPTRAE